MEERLAEIERQKQEAQNKNNSMYEGLLQDNQNLYENQKSIAEQYEQSQNDILDKQLAFNEQKIEQQKETARQNMEAENQRAKNDYFSYINPYGVQTESLASQGLLNSGVSETAKLGGYNTYQNRLSNANKVMQDAFTQYDNDMNEARLNNDVQKAQNALNKLQSLLQYAESYFSQKSTLSQNQLQNSQNIDSEYYGRYSDEYNRYQEEQARQESIRQWEAEMAEQQRQFDEQMAYQKQQDQLAQQNWEKQYQLSKTSTNSSSSGGGYLLDSNDDNLDEGQSQNLGANGTILTGNKSANGLNIVANPYTGNVNPDTQYGVFNWNGKGEGYMPDNVGGKKLTKYGQTFAEFTGVTGNTGSTGINIDNQSVWAANGRAYVWDGSQNQYIDITDLKRKANSSSNSSSLKGFLKKYLLGQK